MQHAEDLNTMRAEPAGVIGNSGFMSDEVPKIMLSKCFLPLARALLTGQERVKMLSSVASSGRIEGLDIAATP